MTIAFLRLSQTCVQAILGQWAKQLHSTSLCAGNYLKLLHDNEIEVIINQTVSRVDLITCSWAHLNDISILDNCPQQLAIFRLILFLLQISSMLEVKSTASQINSLHIFKNTISRDNDHSYTSLTPSVTWKFFHRDKQISKRAKNWRCRSTYVEFVEEHCVSGAVAARLRSLPELFLCRISVHGTQSEKAIWGKREK